jgi:hypothetical protein
MVFQRGYGLANGPNGNIKYLGTYGMESWLAEGSALDQVQTNIANNASGTDASFAPIPATLNNLGLQSQATEEAGIKPLGDPTSWRHGWRPTTAW